MGQLETLGQAGLLREMLKPAGGDVQQITALYANASYSPRPPGPREKYQAIMAWNRLEVEAMGGQGDSECKREDALEGGADCARVRNRARAMDIRSYQLYWDYWECQR